VSDLECRDVIGEARLRPIRTGITELLDEFVVWRATGREIVAHGNDNAVVVDAVGCVVTAARRQCQQNRR
jgi:hypothetical protein